MTTTDDAIKLQLQTEGFATRPGWEMRAWLEPSWTDWRALAESWNDLGVDQHMADGGRYRRRRYAVFHVARGNISRAPHQPHYQAKVDNRLNGGLERWFEPVVPEVGQHPIIRALIRRFATIFETIAPTDDATNAWHVELHQFRIEARTGTTGLPTPEGIHRDGVDGAFVMLINRDNVASGITSIFDAAGTSLGQFTLSEAGDAVFLDDARVYHGVTAIAPVNAAQPAIRDVLVITFSRPT